MKPIQQPPLINARKFMPAVSFIIPSYNSHLTIEKTIGSIFRQQLQEQIAEVIVVDSSDDDKTRKVFKKFNHAKLRVISMDRKTSPSGGRNIGAAAATGTLLCFIDSDVFLADDWLSNILDAVKNGCRAGCGSVSAPDFQQKSALALAQLYLQFNESLAVGETRKVAMVPACNMFVECSLFHKAGCFPDLRASEDVMLCLKIGETDGVWFVPSAKCYHIFRENLRSYFNNQIVLGKYIIVYRRMVYDKWYYKRLWPVLMLPGFLIIKSARIKLRIFKAGGEHFRKFLISSPLFAAGLWYWAVGFVQGCFEKEH
jgi:glycosyltransferase involved in cell wall biosynthesis